MDIYRERETERQTDRQTDRQREKERQAESLTDRQTGRQAGRKLERSPWRPERPLGDVCFVWTIESPSGGRQKRSTRNRKLCRVYEDYFRFREYGESSLHLLDLCWEAIQLRLPPRWLQHIMGMGALYAQLDSAMEPGPWLFISITRWRALSKCELTTLTTAEVWCLFVCLLVCLFASTLAWITSHKVTHYALLTIMFQ